MLDASRPPLGRWFNWGEVNSCYNALDLSVERGRAEQTALIYGSPGAGTIKSITYRELQMDSFNQSTFSVEAQDFDFGFCSVNNLPNFPSFDRLKFPTSLSLFSTSYRLSPATLSATDSAV